MLALLGMIVIAIWFYEAAKITHRNAVLWSAAGLGLYVVPGYILLLISEKYILKSETISDALAVRWDKTLLELASVIIIFALAYMVQQKYLSKNNPD